MSFIAAFHQIATELLDAVCKKVISRANSPDAEGTAVNNGAEYMPGVARRRRDEPVGISGFAK